MIESRILYRIADVDEPRHDVVRRTRPNDAGWDIFILNGRARRWCATEGAGAFSIKWMAEGQAGYEVERRRSTITRQTVMLVDQDQPYGLEFETRTGAQSYCLFFREALVREAWASLEAGFDDAVGEGPMRAFPNLAYRPSAILSALLGDLSADGPDACDAQIEGRALLALSEAVAAAHRHRRLTARAPAAKPATRIRLLASLERARTRIEDLGGVGVDLASLARDAGASRFHLLRLFKAVYGATPMAFAERVRIDRAATALRRSDRSVAEIAAQAGYESPSAFAKAFRRRKGASPAAWRT